MQHPEVTKFAQLTLNCCHTTLGSAKMIFLQILIKQQTFKNFQTLPQYYHRKPNSQQVFKACEQKHVIDICHYYSICLSTMH